MLSNIYDAKVLQLSGSVRAQSARGCEFESYTGHSKKTIVAGDNGKSPHKTNQLALIKLIALSMSTAELGIEYAILPSSFFRSGVKHLQVFVDFLSFVSISIFNQVIFQIIGLNNAYSFLDCFYMTLMKAPLWN